MGRPKKIQRKADFHVHTEESFDGSLTTEKVHMDALRYNVDYIGICNHNGTKDNRAFILRHGGKLSNAINVIDGVNYINTFEINVDLIYDVDSRGKPVTLPIHVKVSGASQEEDCLLEQLLAVKSDNDDFVAFCMLQHISTQIGAPLPEAYIKDYILERRREDPKFSRFDAEAAVDFLDTFNLLQGRSERELTKILKNIPRPKRVFINAKDLIDMAHSCGAVVTFAHPAKTLDKVPVEDRKKVIEKLLEFNIDGFERVYNSATPEINTLIDDCISLHYSVNDYLDDVGSDNHHVCPGCPIGHTYTGEITVDKAQTMIRDLEKRQYEIDNGLGWHRVYAPIPQWSLTKMIQFYQGLNEKFKQEFINNTTPGVSGPGNRS